MKNDRCSIVASGGNTKTKTSDDYVGKDVDVVFVEVVIDEVVVDVVVDVVVLVAVVVIDVFVVLVLVVVVLVKDKHDLQDRTENISPLKRRG